MGVLSSQFVFVGSADGRLCAFRRCAEDATLLPAGSYNAGNLSFFALGRQTSECEIWVFVSGKLSVTALLYSPSTLTFRKIADAPTAGSGTHVAATAEDPEAPTRHTVLLAHYHEHAFSTFRFCERAGFSEESVIRPGKHPHQAKVRGPLVYVPCLGSNSIAQYRIVWEHRPSSPLSKGAPSLFPLCPPSVSVPGGPRHMAFLPHTPAVFVLCELESRLELLEIGDDGGLCRIEGSAVFTHPDSGGHWSSDVAVQPDGALAYAVNRDPPEIVSFALTEGSAPRRVGRLALTAPVRSFAMAPDGSHLQVGGEDGVLNMVSISGEMSECSSVSGLGDIRHTEIAVLRGQS